MNLVPAVMLLCGALLVCRSDAHVHVQVSFVAQEWRLFVRDFESGDFDPSEVPLVVAPAAHGLVQAPSFTNVLGPVGSEA